MHWGKEDGFEVEACRNLGPCIASVEGTGIAGHMEYLPQILLFARFLERPQDLSLEILVIQCVEEADFGPSICGVYHCDRAGSMMSLLPSTPLCSTAVRGLLTWSCFFFLI